MGMISQVTQGKEGVKCRESGEDDSDLLKKGKGGADKKKKKAKK